MRASLTVFLFDVVRVVKVVSSKQLLPNIEDYFCNINYVCLKYPSDVWVTVCLLNLRKVVTPFWSRGECEGTGDAAGEFLCPAAPPLQPD